MDRLDELEKARERLRRGIKQFGSHPASLETAVEGRPARFTIGSDGRCTRPPERGVFGWAKGWPWKDLKKMLERQGHEVAVIH